MIGYAKIKEHCNNIGITDNDIINYVYSCQDHFVKSGYAGVKITRFCDLTPKKFADRIIKNIKENKTETFTKSHYNCNYDDYHKELLIEYFNSYNDLTLYIMGILSQNKQLKVKDVLWACSNKFNFSERTAHKYIQQFIDGSKENWSVERFILYLKHTVLK